MGNLGNRKLYEDIIFIIARNVRSLVERLGCRSLNESVDYNDLLSGFLYETGCNVRCYLMNLDEGRNEYWTEDEIRKYIEDNDIKTRTGLWAKSGGAYVAARRLGILDDFFKKYAQSDQSVKWTEESIRQFVKDNNIKTRSELDAKAKGVYGAARRLGILDDLFGKREIKWTEESIRQFVKDNNIKTRKELATKSGGAYNIANKLGILDDLFGEEKYTQRTKWTEESIRQFVEDNDIKTRSELQAKSAGAYGAARKLGIIAKLFPEDKRVLMPSIH